LFKAPIPSTQFDKLIELQTRIQATLFLYNFKVFCLRIKGKKKRLLKIEADCLPT
jgi:hypothetical protein